ncbi:hypothetical protein [Burkholderia ambifaria]|jgi:hypothetical protein|uniref:hypothetical protein n=1 Tax=Burkholderia ambifaria TaxID=152480 RepID=UPI00158865A6|nr:hypothetical protein [Burkholderia ambifaria]
MLAQLISSQRHLDQCKVADKAARFQVFVVRVAQVWLRGRPYRLIVDGHHNLAAARAAGVEPTWKGPPNKWKRIQRTTNPVEFERFLINNLTDSDYYDVETGQVVPELLGRA